MGEGGREKHFGEDQRRVRPQETTEGFEVLPIEAGGISEQKPELKEETIEINWVSPDIVKEQGEIERAARFLVREKEMQSEIQDLEERIKLASDEEKTQLEYMLENKLHDKNADDRKEYYNNKPKYAQQLKKLQESVSSAQIEDLTEEIWEKLDNSESHAYVRPGYLEDAQKFAERKSHNRDWKDIVNGIQKKCPMKVPIILIKSDGTPYLIAGNTRLMVFRAMMIRPKALIVRLVEDEK